MSEKIVRQHLRAALEEVVAVEKAALHKKLDEQDKVVASRIGMMRPVLDALKSLDTEVGAHDGFKFLFDTQSATIDLNKSSSSSSHTLKISTNEDNSAFDIREEYICDIPDYCYVKHHEFAAAEEALKMVVEEVGKIIAIQQVTKERRNS